MEAENDPVGTDEETRRLAAVLAALDPTRRRERRNILISAAIDVLASRGPTSSSALLGLLQSVFQTRALVAAELEESLLEAKEAHLVESVSGAGDTVLWQASPGMQEESEEIHRLAASELARFKDEVANWLDEAGVELSPVERESAHLSLIKVLAAGCTKLAEGHDQAFAFLRPLTFDLEALKAELRRISSPALRNAVDEMAKVAVDPDDRFGNEMLHLLVVTSVLVIFMKKRDLGHSPSLTDTRLLLDTQVLIDLVDEESEAREVVKSLIELSLGLGVQIVVANHILGQWRGLWDAADRENPGSINGHELIGAAAELQTDNPFINKFLRAREMTPSLTWRRYKRSRIDMRSTLTSLGVTIQPHGNDSEDDKRFVAQMRLTMETRQRSAMRVRGESGLTCDAESAAMVARWRRNDPGLPCKAYFVGSDNLIRRAYREVLPEDTTPLTVHPGAWLMYVATLSGDDVDITELAKVVSSNAVREAFFGVAATYTLEEVLALSSLLKEDDAPMSVEARREALQLDLNDLFKEMQGATPQQRAITAAAEVMKRVHARQNERIRKMRREAEEIKASGQESTAQAAVVVARMEAERTQSEAQLAAISDELTKTKGALDSAQQDLDERASQQARTEDTKRRNRRKYWAVGFGIVLVAAVAALIAGGVIVRWGRLVAVLPLAYYYLIAKDFVEADGPDAKRVRREALKEIILVLLSMLVRF